ncbi:hypothetical protein [Helicobacter sp. 23-1045]
MNAKFRHCEKSHFGRLRGNPFLDSAKFVADSAICSPSLAEGVRGRVNFALDSANLK